MRRPAPPHVLRLAGVVALLVALLVAVAGPAWAAADGPPAADTASPAGARRLPVCVVGAGITGASTAYFLSQFCQHAADAVATSDGNGISGDASGACGRSDTVVFERDARVGGRIESQEVAPGVFAELGAAVAIRQNKLMMYFAEQALGLRTEPRGSYVADTVGILSTDRGVGMVLAATWTGALSFLNKLAALWRFGWTVVSAKGRVLSLIERFDEIYDGIGDCGNPTAGGGGGEGVGSDDDGDGGTAAFTPRMTPRTPPFKSVGAMLDSVGMKDLPSLSLYEGLERLGIPHTSAYAREMADAATRINYNQGSGEISALAGFMGLSANKEDLWSVAPASGGNAAIPAGLLRLAGARVRTGATVTAVDRVSASGGTAGDFYYAVHYHHTATAAATDGDAAALGAEDGGTGGDGSSGVDDGEDRPAHIQHCGAVVLAAPFVQSAVRLLPGVTPSVLDTAAGRRGAFKDYVRTVATFVATPSAAAGGGLDAAYFNSTGWFGSAGAAPELVLTTQPFQPHDDEEVEIEVSLDELAGGGGGGGGGGESGLPFSSVGLVARVGNQSVWKVFSKAPLSDAALSSMFVGGAYSVLREKDWRAYPHYSAPEPLLPFEVEQQVEEHAHGNHATGADADAGASGTPAAPAVTRLFYASAYELASSAMEVGAIAGHNAASLVWHSFATGTGADGGAGSVGAGGAAAATAATSPAEFAGATPSAAEREL